MSVNEANAIIDSISDVEKVNWERVRWSAYIQALTAGAKLKSPQSLIKFQWEMPINEEVEDNKTIDNRTTEEIRADFENMLSRL